MHSNWSGSARAFIAELDKELGPDATLEERKKKLRAEAWRFHAYTSWGRKVWAKEARAYLERHGLPPRTPADASPQSKLHARLQSGDIAFPLR